MGSGSSKPKQAKKTPNPQPTKNNTKSAPVPTQTIVPRIAETNPDKMETKPDPVETKANPKEVNQAETDGSHVAWRDVNVASLIHENPDEPWWEIADKLVPNALTVVKPDLHRRGWKTVRLFVSSTFKDMHSEREYLVKRIFPQLRQWCEDRRLRLVECDLRWGVPKDASTRQTLLACLSEIDRCYEENDYPYILALLSDRYGWVPTENEVPPDIKHRYKWIPGMSVTTLEVMTGGMWSKNPNALYMLRDPSYLKALENDPLLSSYQEKEEEYKKSLEVLKSKLHGLKSNGGKVATYDCKVASKSEKRAELIGLEKFGEEVMAHFQVTLERQYPACSLGKELTEEELQALQHEVFMYQRSALLLGRDDVLAEVESYIHEEKSNSVPLVMIGFPGAGKSAVMAAVSRRTLTKPECKVFYHFVGATPGSTDLMALLTRIWQELMPAEDKPPVDPNELRRSLGVVLENASEHMVEENKTRLVLFIDALNQLDEDTDEMVLDWLPRLLPKNVRIVVSTLEGPILDALRKTDKAKLPEVLVAPLNEDTRRSIVTQVLSEYNKALDEEQLSLLVSKEDAGRPLYLTIACEELRVFGDFRKLTEKVKGLSQDLTNLLVQVLDRIIAENGGDLVVATLRFIECSRFGLLENELLQLLAPHSNMESESSIDRLPMAEWAVVYLGLRPFLRPAGGSGEGRLDFYHRTISKSVRAKYLDDTQKASWHKKLADHFQNSTDLDRRAEELPYQLMQVGDVEGMKKALVENSMFERLYTPSSKQNLMTYWTFAGGYKVAAEMHLEALNSYLQDHKKDVSPDAALAAQTKMVNFFTDIGEYEKAELLLERVIESAQEQFGPDSKEVCGPLFAAVILFYLQGIKVVYSSDPVYRRCHQLGSKHAKLCYRVHKLHFKEDDIHLGRVITKCGYFIGGYLEEAKKICMSQSQQDYAEVLYTLGEKNQYESINIPVALFEESLKLCLNHFGFYHLSTARCYQLYGQLYWNQYTSMNRDSSYMVTCLSFYEKELEILETLLGKVHPTTVRSREDVIIILQTLDRNREAAVLQESQPE